MSQSPETAGDRGAVSGYGAAWARLMQSVRSGESWSGGEPNRCFINSGGERFVDVSHLSGLDFRDDGRAIAVCDWDRDGDLDLWLRNRTAPRVRLMVNAGAGGGGAVMLKLEGVHCNRDAVGAVVEMSVAGAPPLVRTVRAGEMFLSQSSKWLHFGLGADGVVGPVRVRWPGGEAEDFAGVVTGGRFVLRQGSGKAAAADASAAIEIPPKGALPPTADVVPGKVVLPAAAPVPAIRYRDRVGKTRDLRTSGEPRLLLLWESGCPVCEKEIAAHAAARTGLEVVALAADGIETAGEAYAVIDRTGFGGGWGFVAPASLTALWRWGGALFDRLPEPAVPLALLLDGRGRCVAVYRGAVPPDEIARDAAQLADLDPTARWHLAPQFLGTWFTNPVPDTFVRETLGR